MPTLNLIQEQHGRVFMRASVAYTGVTTKRVLWIILAGILSACGREPGPSQPRSFGGNGRLTCAGFSDPAGRHERISGCTQTQYLEASSPTFAMAVERNGADLAITLRNKQTGAAWNGLATLRYPPGGTGTRARVLVNQPILSLFSCEVDTLLRCGR